MEIQLLCFMLNKVLLHQNNGSMINQLKIIEDKL